MVWSLFSRLIVRVLALCLLLCAAVPIVSGRPPAPDDAWDRFGFTYCALPCYAGIMPGQTSFDQAGDLLFDHLPTLDSRLFTSGLAINFWATIQTQRLAGWASYKQGNVGEIRFNVLLPIRQVVAQLGAPDCIVPNLSGDPLRVTVILWYRDGVSIGAVLGADESALNLDVQTLALWLRAITPNDCTLRGAIPWRGFAPVWEYAR